VKLFIDECARMLRRGQIQAEARLWAQLRAHRFFGAKFHRQFRLGDFIADFCCREKRLAIELDGGPTWIARDRRETYFAMEARGFSALRFWNIEVFENLEGVLAETTLSLARISHHGGGFRANSAKDSAQGNALGLSQPVGRRPEGAQEAVLRLRALQGATRTSTVDTQGVALG
jgi:very-short-patch-repair endonuclease